MYLLRYEFNPLRLIRYFPALILLLFAGTTTPLNAQVIRKSSVEFYSSDSLLISADHYYSNKDNPYILLFHQEGSSRGEFDQIARRFVKMKFNCLAVDLRNGGKFEYVENLTSQRAKEKLLPAGIETGKDILAAIDFAQSVNEKNVILLGSSWSASMCLKVASEDERVSAVMAFSPGEFLRPMNDLADLFSKLQKPVFVAGSPMEYPYLVKSTRSIPEGFLSLVNPPERSVERGIPMLFDTNPGHNEYWFSVLIFIKSLKT